MTAGHGGCTDCLPSKHKEGQNEGTAVEPWGVHIVTYCLPSHNVIRSRVMRHECCVNIPSHVNVSVRYTNIPQLTEKTVLDNIS